MRLSEMLYAASELGHTDLEYAEDMQQSIKAYINVNWEEFGELCSTIIESLGIINAIWYLHGMGLALYLFNEYGLPSDKDAILATKTPAGKPEDLKSLLYMVQEGSEHAIELYEYLKEHNPEQLEEI